MWKVSFMGRLAAALAAAAFFVSGCDHYMPSHAGMDGGVTMASRQVSKADRAGYTVATVEKALRLYDSKGREATLAYYNSPESVDGEWYVIIADENKEIIAHPNPDVLGESLFGPRGVDFTGYRHGEAIAGATEAGKWVDYIFLNPATGRDEYKHTWAVRHDGLIFATGWYRGFADPGAGGHEGGTCRIHGCVCRAGGAVLQGARAGGGGCVLQLCRECGRRVVRVCHRRSATGSSPIPTRSSSGRM